MSEVDVVLSSTKELDYGDLEAVGIDTSTIAVCKKLRRLAKLDRLRMDETTHRSGINKHLFDYIECQGLDVLGL